MTAPTLSSPPMSMYVNHPQVNVYGSCSNPLRYICCYLSLPRHHACHLRYVVHPHSLHNMSRLWPSHAAYLCCVKYGCVILYVTHNASRKNPLCARSCGQLTSSTSLQASFLLSLNIRKLKRVLLCAQLWLVDYFYLIAGILFFVSGLLYVMKEISIWVVPGDSLLLSLHDLCSGVVMVDE